MAAVMLALFVIAILYAISWLIVCGIIKLITLCFGWTFSLAIATGIWLIFVLVKIVFDRVVTVNIKK